MKHCEFIWSLLRHSLVGSSRKNWAIKLGEALWAYMIPFKTLTSMSSYHLVYGKVCHLPIEYKYKATWTIERSILNWKRREKECYNFMNYKKFGFIPTKLETIQEDDQEMTRSRTKENRLLERGYHIYYITEYAFTVSSNRYFQFCSWHSQ